MVSLSRSLSLPFCCCYHGGCKFLFLLNQTLKKITCICEYRRECEFRCKINDTTHYGTTCHTSKSCGDGRVATGTGGGCCWESLVTDLHAGGTRVTVVCSSRGDDVHSCPSYAPEQSFLGSVLLSPITSTSHQLMMLQCQQYVLHHKSRNVILCSECEP